MVHNRVLLGCTDLQWVLADLIILYPVILIKAHPLQAINKVLGTGLDPTDHPDHLEALGDPVDLRNKDHRDQDPGHNTGHLECSSTVDHPDLRDKDHLVDHPVILADLQAILEELRHVLTGTDLLGCITDLKDHQVFLNINICKVLNQVKVPHKEDLLQGLWVVQVDLHQVTVDHRKALHKGLLEDRRLMSIQRSSLKDLRINILDNIPAALPDPQVLLTDRLMVHHTDLLMARLMVHLIINRMDHRMYLRILMGHLLYSLRTALQVPITDPKDHRLSLSRNLKKSWLEIAQYLLQP